MENEQGTVENNEPVAQEQPVQEEVKPETKHVGGSAFYKQKLADAERRNAELASKVDEIQSKNLQEKENFKELWELEKNKRIEAEENRSKLAMTVSTNFKNSAIKQEAIKAGILDTAIEDLDIIDNSLVEIETTDRGSINVLGAKEFVDQLKDKKPHWFSKSGIPNINNSNPEVTKTKEMSSDEIIKLQKTDPERYKVEMRKKLGIV